MAKKKISRKELLREDDAFVRSASQGAQWLGDHSSQLRTVLVLLTIVVASVWGGLEYSEMVDSRASEALRDAFATRDGEIVIESDTVKASPKATPPTFPSSDEKWRATLAAFEKVVAEGGGMVSVAKLYIADAHEQIGDLAAARAVLDTLAGELSPEDTLFFLVIERLATLRETDKDLDGAIATWDRLRGARGGFFTDRVSFHQARLKLELGQHADARELLERVQRDYPSSSIREDTRVLLADLEVKGSATPSATAE